MLAGEDRGRRQAYPRGFMIYEVGERPYVGAHWEV